MNFVKGKVVLTAEERTHNAMYEAKRNHLIPKAYEEAERMYGDLTAQYFETAQERQERDSMWNLRFHTVMNELAKGITYETDTGSC
jgi:inosine-uridine nucleoside N-ribohydrolase